jgi:hypothetical protein
MGQVDILQHNYKGSAATGVQHSVTPVACLPVPRTDKCKVNNSRLDAWCLINGSFWAGALGCGGCLGTGDTGTVGLGVTRKER